MNATWKTTACRAAALAAVAFAVAAALLAASARRDLRLLEGRLRLAAGLRGDFSRLARYEAAEAYLRGFGAEAARPPQLPMSVAKPDEVRQESPAAGPDWSPSRLVYTWRATSARDALEALAALDGARDGWRVADVSFRALEDGSGVAISVAVETARPSAAGGE